VFVAAGAAFHVTVEARDSEGALTPNYGNEASAEGIKLQASTLVAPAGGQNGTANDGAIGNASAFSSIAPAGTFKGTTFYWDEVGAIRLTASVSDSDYLDTGNVTGGESGDVGRFNPDHFDTSINTPQFTTACAVGSFTYLGQDFSFTSGLEPEISITAENLQGTTTQNYTGSWFLLSSGTLTGLAFAAASGTLAVPAPNAPSVSDDTAVEGTITFDQGPAQSFTRTTEVAPFDADLSLSVNVLDSDGVAYASNPIFFGAATAGNGIAFSTDKEIRFGRLRLNNAHNSELVTLSVPLEAEYWNGTGFVTHTDDSCTPLVAGELLLTATPGGLSTTPVIANSPLSSGRAGLSLSATGEGNTGYFDLSWDLSAATGEDLEYLWGDWDGDSSYDDDPTARATFGIYRGRTEIIYLREIY
jgi:MSHA biogenesis protein MshQ